MIDDGIDLNKGDDEGIYPVHYASRSGNLEKVKLLHQHGANLNQLT